VFPEGIGFRTTGSPSKIPLKTDPFFPEKLTQPKSINSPHGKDAQEIQVVIDTTVQEKNITSPADMKLQRKIVRACVRIATAEKTPLRQTYTRTVKHLVYVQRGRNNIGTRKTALKAARRHKTISGSLLRELQKKLPIERLTTYERKLAIYAKRSSARNGTARTRFTASMSPMCTM
jgi:IS5 family transposase